MANPVDSANLILKLYELRREETMRKARDFMVSYDPQTFEELMAGFFGPNGAYIRMVTGYWEMAASFVVNGAIDAKMFDDSTGEHVLVFAKMEPFLPQLREAMKNPRAMKSFEQVCLNMPDARNRIDSARERIRELVARRAATANTNAPASAEGRSPLKL